MTDHIVSTVLASVVVAATTLSCSPAPPGPTVPDGRSPEPAVSATAATTATPAEPPPDPLKVTIGGEPVALENVILAAVTDETIRIAVSDGDLPCNKSSFPDYYADPSAKDRAFNIILTKVWQEDGTRNWGIRAASWGGTQASGSRFESTVSVVKLDLAKDAMSDLRVEMSLPKEKPPLSVSGLLRAKSCGDVLRAKGTPNPQPELELAVAGQKIDIQGALVEKSDDEWTVKLSTQPIDCDGSAQGDVVVRIRLRGGPLALAGGDIAGYGFTTTHSISSQDPGDDPMVKMTPPNPKVGGTAEIHFSGKDLLMATVEAKIRGTLKNLPVCAW